MNRLLILTALLSVLATGCNGTEPQEQAESDGPKLVSTSPADGATDVQAPTATITFTFDRNICCPTSQNSLVNAGDAVIDKVFASGKTVSTTLSSLELSTAYTLTFPKGTITDFSGGVADAISLTFTTAAKSEENEEGQESGEVVPENNGNAAWQMMEVLGMGYNLGNQLDAYDGNNVANETYWGNPKTTQLFFTKLASYGFKSVRIPVTWMGHIGEAPSYTLEKAWLDRVAEVVGYAKTAGLNCIINTHHDECHADDHWLDVAVASRDSVAKAQITAKLCALWRQVAERFIDEGDYLIFEPFNELNDGGWGWSTEFQRDPIAQTSVLDEWNQAFVDTVRATGGCNATRWLCAAGYAASSSLTVQYLKVPEDAAGRVMVGFHSYDPYDYCLANKYEQWGHTGKAGQKPSDDESAITAMLAKYYKAFVSKGIPCYMGECGCVQKNTEFGKKLRLYYLEYLAKACRTYGIPAFLWDNGAYDTSGENLGYIKHDDGSFIGDGKDVARVMVKGLSDDTPTYTLQSVYDNAPRN